MLNLCGTLWCIQCIQCCRPLGVLIDTTPLVTMATARGQLASGSLAFRACDHRSSSSSSHCSHRRTVGRTRSQVARLLPHTHTRYMPCVRTVASAGWPPLSQPSFIHIYKKSYAKRTRKFVTKYLTALTHTDFAVDFQKKAERLHLSRLSNKRWQQKSRKP